MLKRCIFAVLIILSCLSSVACADKTSVDGSESTKYTIYVGLNDKDTYTQLIPNTEAEKKLGDIAIKYVDDYTLYIAVGVYRDEKGILTKENSLVAEFNYTTEAQIEKIMDELLIDFNQEAVLLEKDQVISKLYKGQP